MSRNEKNAAHAGADGSDEGAGTVAQRPRYFALLALTLVLIGLSVLLAFPFLPAITWGIALGIIAWPIHAWLAARVPWPSVAAGLSSTAVVMIIVIPATFVTYQVALEAAGIAERVQDKSANGDLRERMAAVPGLRGVVAWMERFNLDLETEVRKVLGSFTQDLLGLGKGSVQAVLQFLVAIFILYHFFSNRSALLRLLRDVLPLSRSECDCVFERAATSVHANLYATIVTSVINGVCGGFMFWLVGLPSPFFWGFVMFVMSVLPIVGTGFIWAPAALYLLATGGWLQAAALIAWGLIFFGLNEVLYVRLAGHRMRMHPVPAMVAFLGGLAVFGMSGMILGPAIVAVTTAIIDVWRQRFPREDGVAANA